MLDHPFLLRGHPAGMVRKEGFLAFTAEVMQGTGLKVRKAGRLCSFGQLGLFIPSKTCKIVT